MLQRYLTYCGALILGLAACSAERAANPAPSASRIPDASLAGEGAEASGEAHLDLRVQRATLLAADRSYASAAASINLVDATVAPLAADAFFVIAGASGLVRVQGSDAARALLLANPSNASSTLSWTPLRVDVSSDGTRGYTFGYTEQTLSSGIVLSGKYMAYWARQADGYWRMAAYKRVARKAGPVDLTPPPGFGSPDYKHYRYFPNTDPATELEAVMQTERAFSDLAQVVGNGDAFATYVADDGVNAAGVRSAPWLFGREAIRTLHSTDPLGGFYWTPELGDVARSGDLGFTMGDVKVDTRNPDGTVTTRITGKYFTIWKKQRTGEWRFEVDG